MSMEQSKMNQFKDRPSVFRQNEHSLWYKYHRHFTKIFDSSVVGDVEEQVEVAIWMQTVPNVRDIIKGEMSETLEAGINELFPK